MRRKYANANTRISFFRALGSIVWKRDTKSCLLRLDGSDALLDDFFILSSIYRNFVKEIRSRLYKHIVFSLAVYIHGQQTWVYMCLKALTLPTFCLEMLSK